MTETSLTDVITLGDASALTDALGLMAAQDDDKAPLAERVEGVLDGS